MKDILKPSSIFFSVVLLLHTIEIVPFVLISHQNTQDHTHILFSTATAVKLRCRGKSQPVGPLPSMT